MSGNDILSSADDLLSLFNDTDKKSTDKSSNSISSPSSNTDGWFKIASQHIAHYCKKCGVSSFFNTDTRCFKCGRYEI